MATKYVPNAQAVAQYLRSPEAMKAMGVVAEDIKDIAYDIAPEDEGDYKDGLEADYGVDTRGALGRVNANDWKSGMIEFGTGGASPTPTFAVLRRAVQQSGHRATVKP